MQCKMICAGALAALAMWPAAAGVKWYAVDPMGERPYMPDKAPEGGREGAPLRMVAARGEYEPCSFVLVADQDMGKVRIEPGDLKNEKGETFPKGRFDLKTVKVWYQAGNAWTSYFADPKLRLIPELLLNDEDLIKVDTKKGWNYARLTEKDGTVRYHWLNPPRQVDCRNEDGGDRKAAFFCMRPNFCDAKTHQGATLKKGEYKQFFLTAEVGKDVKPGLYRGEVKVKGEGELWTIPLVLRVLDFELPRPMCYFDTDKEFVTWFCEDVSVSTFVQCNGNDKALAERQVVAVLKDFRRHNETMANYGDKVEHPELGREAGMEFPANVFTVGTYLGEKAEMRYQARRSKEDLTRKFGWKPFIVSWGDEYGLPILRGIRDMIRIYHDEGFRFALNSNYGYQVAGYLSDLWWPPRDPDHHSAAETFKFNQLGGDGYFAWYASHHVGVENPAFCRRQYGFGPYRAGLSGNFNYEHNLREWNDLRNQYRAMSFVYGSGDGCIDTISWEGFREGIDDIRYATLLKQLAEPLVKGTTEQRYAAKKALQLLADADGDDMDLTTLRLEMIEQIKRLMALKSR